ncbi:MAG: hypothetical protein ACRD0H_05180, partial [Actinomycetes bacterium]
RPLPLWYLGAAFLLPVAVISTWDLFPQNRDAAFWIGILALALVHHYLQKLVHHSLGVERRLRYDPSGGWAPWAFGAGAVAVVVAFSMIFMNGGPGVALPSVTLGVLAGAGALVWSLLDHRRIRRAAANVAA